MKTGRFLLIVAAVLAVLTSIAMVWRPKPEDDGRTKLVWVSDNNPARAEQIGMFNTVHPELDLTLDYANSGLQKIILQCVSGVGPDVFSYSDEQLQTLVEAGVLMDVTDEAQAMGFSAAEAAWPGAREQMTYFGRQYGYSFNVDVYLLIYNKNIFDAFGVPYPEGLMTVEEFTELARKVNGKVPGSNENVYAVQGMNWKILFSCLRGEFFTPEGRPDIANSEALKRAIATHRELIFTERVMPTSVDMKAMSGQGGWGAGSLNQFAAGKFAMTFSGQWSLTAIGRTYMHQVEALRAQGLKPEDVTDPMKRPLRLGAVLIPKYAGTEPTYRVLGRVVGVNRYSPHREKALTFLQYLTGPELSLTINQSIDALPGNPKYANLGLEEGPPDLARMEMHEKTTEAMAYGYIPRRSPYLLTSDVIRVLESQVSRMESMPSIPVERLLADAQKELDVLMRRNLERNPELKERYDKQFPSSTP